MMYLTFQSERSFRALAQPVAALACVIALLALADAPSIGLGRDQARARPLSGTAALQHAERAGIDIGAVIASMRHRVEPVKGEDGAFLAEARLYRSRFDARGFSLSFRAPRSARFERTPGLAVAT